MTECRCLIIKLFLGTDGHTLSLSINVDVNHNWDINIFDNAPIPNIFVHTTETPKSLNKSR